jgi:CHAD domain-containing protein
MARRLRPDAVGTDKVRGIVRREAKKALKRLPSSRQPQDVAVHDARKRIKKARAALRLIREPLGERRFHRENEALRDAARPLSEVRDAKILVEAFDGLVGASARANGTGVRGVRDALIGHQLRVRRRLFGGKQPLKPTRSALQSLRRRADRWPLSDRGGSALIAGVRRVYRAGRKELARVRQHPSDESLHEWRKQTKYLWHQLEMLEPMAPSILEAMVRQAHQLSDYLGDDHDLAVLRVRLSRMNGRAPRTALRSVVRRIGRARSDLRAKALEVGERVYAEKPRRFSKRLEDLWRAWREKQAR